jgi:primosomal replication protein N
LPNALNAVHLSGRLLSQVSLEIDAIAIGDVALKLDKVGLGEVVRVQGFLANRSKRSRRAMLHVNEFDIE